MSKGNQVHIAVIGVGGVGTHFLSQLSALLPKYPNITLRLLSRSTKSLTGTPTNPISLQTWPRDLSSSLTPSLTIPETLALLSQSAPKAKAILIDNTSSQALANSYPDFLSRGISIVTPNKKAFSSSLPLWYALHTSTHTQPSPSNTTPTRGLLYHESTVGAALPILSTLSSLLQTSDQIHKILGVFSGTLSYLFNTYNPPSPTTPPPPWSTVVRSARSAGYTEPDPRDDLNGQDVARKLVILARMLGMDVAGTDSFEVESLIPPELEDVGSAEEFMTQLKTYDTRMEEVRERAGKERKVVRYVGSIDVKTKVVKVGIAMFDRGHPIAMLKGSDNIVSFYTERYGNNPLVVQGAGAGGAVTAMGVTADLIKVIERIS